MPQINCLPDINRHPVRLHGESNLGNDCLPGGLNTEGVGNLVMHNQKGTLVKKNGTSILMFEPFGKQFPNFK